ncbi:MAG: chromosomal replication initiator protein DnaA [Parcubacteria group bacterium]|nr:chromosomal replication initiator protein DnaA [Parcubacteria group bacterium]
MDNKQLWENVLSDLEIGVSKANFSTWFKNTYIVKQENGIIFLGVPNGFAREWLSNKYHKSILRSLRNLNEGVRSIEYIITKNEPREVKEAVQLEEKAPAYAGELPLKDLYINKEDNLNPRYGFESFVVGPFNEIAYAAAQSVMKKPGDAYNPLFIYGKTGLGKTHLMQAVGNGIKQAHENKKVYYLTAEKFYLDYINSVQMNKISIFKEKYRKYDVLIMDDIHYFEGKGGTQDEFFHLFNTLYNNNKQMIFSADRHYNYAELEERLKSRLGQGMIVDIMEPDFESKVVILKSKSKQANFELPDEIIEYVSSATQSSIRELEGILNMIICQVQLKNRELSIQEIKSLIKHNERPKKMLSVDDVVRVVSDFYNVERDHIYKKTRRKEIVKPRQIIMYILREDFNISYPTIGQKMGGRDHTTVIHSCEKIRNNLKENNMLVQEVERIRSMF